MTVRISPLLLAVTLLVPLTVTPINPCALRADSARVCGSLFASAVLSETSCIIVGDRGRIFLSNDGAETWQAVESRTKYALATVCFPDERNGWIAGQMGTLLHSADGGRTWQPQAAGVDAYLLDIDFLDARHGIVVGGGTTVLITEDGGATWAPSPLKTSAGLFGDLNLFAVAMMDSRNICAVGDMGRIFTTEDGGRTWVETKTPLYDEQMMMGRILYALVYDSGTLYAAGIDSTFAFSKDRGKSWTVGDTGFSKPDLYCIDVVGDFGMAAGSGGHVIQTSDRGLTWHLVEVPETINRDWLSGMDLERAASGEVTGLVVGERGVYGHLQDGAIDWR